MAVGDEEKIYQMGKTWSGIQVMAQDQLTDVKGLNCCPTRDAGVMGMSVFSCCILLGLLNQFLTVQRYTSEDRTTESIPQYFAYFMYMYFTTAHLRI